MNEFTWNPIVGVGVTEQERWQRGSNDVIGEAKVEEVGVES
jgi:hypothetical protein